MKSFKILLLSLCSAALIAASVPTPTTYAAKESTQVTISDKKGELKSPEYQIRFSELDKKTQETVQKQIKELVGTDIDLEVDSVTKRKDLDGKKMIGWAIEFTDTEKANSRNGNSIAINNKGEITGANIAIPLGKLDDARQKKLMTMLSDVDSSLDTAKNNFYVGIDKMPTYYEDKKTGELKPTGQYDTRVTMRHREKRNMEVTISDDGFQLAKVTYPIEQIDSSVLQTAKTALQNFSDSGSRSLSTALRYKQIFLNFNRNVWKLTDNDKKHGVSVEVGAKSGKLTSIEVNTDISAKDNKAYDNMKLNKIKETVAPIAQKVMGIDLKGYEVKQNKEYDIRNQFIFTKKGSPTLSARVDVKGKCYSLAVTSVDGKAD